MTVNDVTAKMEKPLIWFSTCESGKEAHKKTEHHAHKRSNGQETQQGKNRNERLFVQVVIRELKQMGTKRRTAAIGCSSKNTWDILSAGRA
jgi:hypothetical protein